MNRDPRGSTFSSAPAAVRRVPAGVGNQPPVLLAHHGPHRLHERCSRALEPTSSTGVPANQRRASPLGSSPPIQSPVHRDNQKRDENQETEPQPFHERLV